jgi:hypothetical protein
MKNVYPSDERAYLLCWWASFNLHGEEEGKKRGEKEDSARL